MYIECQEKGQLGVAMQELSDMNRLPMGNCEEELPKKPVGRLSAVCWPTVGRLSADCRPTVGRQVFPKTQTISRPTVGRQTTDSRPTVGDVSVRCR